ncbi:bifunctional 2-polyprenyl-6-hydroxyphenol methylase/3-demethylubiquinol 3-O-methyltransferase UbiG [Bartonella tribocorum]|uniref:Ubiquinone biosynthesis O-methyltransferase n=1 Tax=Bartonella tribocorum (strain DSM 28219 / CCUG 45778 / CIP 105476 / IBS 506) TaxID=382640 RepID=UBIG_BART1|nr:bifunctional 2-polyprenyl-6-hydroxyphenol methylase/3-demethylubiquinol 3-O-methyltransferase UbiG [Bartonella tribocorum]A9IQF4.1 RecName: Full=Ubiquinone biosynthesis O-methyltransferase; AltName: Full=2-polyprenyl-6-hydroxyphenol methylase; AltName: Full=3-demethylubiquinone 3-O-methyltransferase [Bartonella tribocorum CIP 105476]CAK01051.1 3-demethylubiquinone-9 3-methyltransferase [Bartonella tribocorum CIP 105476]CDO48263.1 3-demethylubiquinone-9 3-methyltransferase [Bartonella tribocor
MIDETRTTVDQSELDHFSRIATEWWNPQGKFRPLHQFNPTRLAYIREKICLEFNRDPVSLMPFDNLKILDIGCGGGLLCEPMARLGATVVGVDAAQTNIDVAKIHAAQNNLSIDYRTTTAEALANEGEKFDIILNMEVVEHVADVNLFINATAKMLKPQGLMFVATLNRTWKAWGFAIIGAEYILRWLPKGTHDYKKFLKPRELKNFLSKNALTVIDEIGITYNPLNDSWNRSKDMDVNYLLLAKRS